MAAYYDNDIKIYRSHGSTALAEQTGRRGHIEEYVLPPEPEEKTQLIRPVSVEAQKNETAFVPLKGTLLLAGLLFLVVFMFVSLSAMTMRQSTYENKLVSIKQQNNAYIEWIETDELLSDVEIREIWNQSTEQKENLLEKWGQAFLKFGNPYILNNMPARN